MFRVLLMAFSTAALQRVTRSEHLHEQVNIEDDDYYGPDTWIVPDPNYGAGK